VVKNEWLAARRLGLVAFGLVLACSPAPDRPAAPTGDLALVGISGQWRVGDEDGARVITMNGELPTRPPDGDAITRLFGAGGPGVLAMASAPGSFPVAVSPDIADFTGGRLQVQFRLIGGASDQIAGLVFDLKPDGTYRYGRYNTKDGNVAIWKFEGGARAVLIHGDAHEQLPLGRWHTLDVAVRDRVVTVGAADGRLTASYTLDAPVSGRIGVWTKSDSITAFKGFRAEPD
jgi:hypothetical protein